jgi:ADP-ribose pyrophosphatase
MDNTQFERLVAEQRAKLNSSFTLQFHGKRFDVLKDIKTQHEVVMHPGAVVILPLQDDDTVIMIQNERFVVGETLWELPAGTIEPNEPPELTAMRELEEETGYKAAFLEPLLNFYTTPGICNEAMYAYVAKDLHFVGQQLDQNEKIVTQAIKLFQVLEMLKSGMIRDGKTIATLLFYSSFKR